MTEDEVVLEVRKAREAFSALHGHNVRAMVEALRKVAITSGRDVVRFAPRPVSSPGNPPNDVRIPMVDARTDSPDNIVVT